MRILVLVDRVPERLDVSAPWHFLQEVGPIARAGHEVLVVSGNATEIALPGVRFQALGIGAADRVLGSLRSPAFVSRMTVRHGPNGLRVGQRIAAFNHALDAVVDRFRPDIMHAHWAWPGGSGGFLAARRARVPLVLTMRGYEHSVDRALGYGACLDPAYEGALRMALAAADRITYCCESSRQRLGELGVRGTERLVHLFHAVDPERLAARTPPDELRRSLGLGPDDPVVSCVGLMNSRSKGHSTLLDAFARVVRATPRARLLLLGDGAMRVRLEEQASSLGLAPMVRFMGKVHPTAIGDFMRISAVTVLPTHMEVFGNVVFESLCVGTPVISGSIGAAQDVLPAGPYGQLFPPGDPAALAACIERVFADPGLHRAQASRGGDFVRERMSLARRVEGFLAVYRELAPARAGMTGRPSPDPRAIPSRGDRSEPK